MKNLNPHNLIYNKSKILQERDELIVAMYYELFEKGFRPNIIRTKVIESEDIGVKFGITKTSFIKNIIDKHTKLLLKLNVKSKQVA